MMACRNYPHSFLENATSFSFAVLLLLWLHQKTLSGGLVFFGVLTAVKLKQVWMANNAAKLTTPARWGLRVMADQSLLVGRTGEVRCLLYIFSPVVLLMEWRASANCMLQSGTSAGFESTAAISHWLTGPCRCLPLACCSVQASVLSTAGLCTFH